MIEVILCWNMKSYLDARSNIVESYVTKWHLRRIFLANEKGYIIKVKWKNPIFVFALIHIMGCPSFSELHLLSKLHKGVSKVV